MYILFWNGRRPNPKTMLDKIPKPAIATISRFLITHDNALTVISRLSLVSKEMHSQMIHLVKYADYYTKSRIIEFLRLRVLKSMHTTMVSECANHPFIDQINTSGLCAHPYYTIRWLLFNTLERAVFDEQRAFFTSVYYLPTFTNDFFEPSVERSRKRMVRFMKDDFEHPAYDSARYMSNTKRELYKRVSYIGMRLQEKVPVISSIGCSVYGTTYFKTLIPMVLEPFCAVCLKRFTGRCHGYSHFCITCNGVVIPTHNQIHDIDDYTKPSTLVKICKSCSHKKNVVNGVGHYHCPLGIDSCDNTDHSGDCNCPCHDATMTSRYSEYLFGMRPFDLNADPYDHPWSVDDSSSSDNSSGA